MTHDRLDMIEYGASPAVLLFGDCDSALSRASRAAERAGCRIAAVHILDATAAERLGRHISPDAVVIEVEQGSEELEFLLDEIEVAARHGRHRSVVSAPEELIDLVAARAPHSDILHLCRPTEAERTAAVALASGRPALRLHDIGRGDGPAVLQQLSEEVGRIASILASLSEEDPAGAAGGSGTPAEEQAVDPAFLRTIIRARRLRDQFFNPALFADPAWDMLLDLMAARLEGSRVAVSSLCIAASVPPTTALRWIKMLTDQGIFVRAADSQDGRRVYVELSEDTERAMSAYLRAAQRTAPWGL